MIEKILSELGKLKVYKEIVTSDKHPFCASEIELLSRKKVLEIVQEVAKDSGWIPCSERLPDEHKKYLVTCEGIDIPQIRLFEGTWDSYAHKVTAWQPLPAPYQKGE